MMLVPRQDKLLVVVWRILMHHSRLFRSENAPPAGVLRHVSHMSNADMRICYRVWCTYIHSIILYYNDETAPPTYAGHEEDWWMAACFIAVLQACGKFYSYSYTNNTNTVLDSAFCHAAFSRSQSKHGTKGDFFAQLVDYTTLSIVSYPQHASTWLAGPRSEAWCICCFDRSDPRVPRRLNSFFPICLQPICPAASLLHLCNTPEGMDGLGHNYTHTYILLCTSPPHRYP